MKAIVPWIRTAVSFPLGLVALQLFHAVCGRVVPSGYGPLDGDAERLLALALATAAGIVGSFVVGAVAGHRIRLHMAIFLALMLVIDLGALRGSLSAQPLWFKALVLATLPLQVWIGGRLASLMSGRSRADAATGR